HIEVVNFVLDEDAPVFGIGTGTKLFGLRNEAVRLAGGPARPDHAHRVDGYGLPAGPPTPRRGPPEVRPNSSILGAGPGALVGQAVAGAGRRPGPDRDATGDRGERAEPLLGPGWDCRIVLHDRSFVVQRSFNGTACGLPCPASGPARPSGLRRPPFPTTARAGSRR